MSKQKFNLFIGPCVLESNDLAMTIAEFLANNLEKFKNQINLIFKGSFDKANRTSIDSYRGPGIDKGLEILKNVKEQFNIPVITDFHYPDQAMIIAEVVDVLQVPAFLCRQTDMIVSGSQACNRYNRSLKIKKGQFLSPNETKNIIDKAINYMDKENIFLTERGTSFGYNNLVVDMSSFEIMKSFGVKAIHDATHCVQKPGGLGDKTDGKREQIFSLSKAAVAAGADGVFMETHPEPTKALSDSATCLELDKIPWIIERLLKIYNVV